MFWCEHFEEDFKCRPIFKEVNKATLFPKSQVGLIMQQVVPSLTVLEKKADLYPPQCVLARLRRSGNRQTASRKWTRKSCDRLLSEEVSASLLRRGLCPRESEEKEKRRGEGENKRGCPLPSHHRPSRAHYF